MSSVEVGNRIYYMDSMRSVLMTLGVVLHSCNLFKIDKTWIISCVGETWLADFLSGFIHIFRMPSFFVISGYFCYYALLNYRFEKYINKKIKRIIIPLISTAFTLNIVQYLIVSRIQHRRFMFYEYFFQGGWVSHLWFLNNLIVYFLITFIFYKIITHRLIPCRLRVESIVKLKIDYLIIIFPVIFVLIKASSRLGVPLYSEIFGFIDVYSLISYYPYFLLGVIMASVNYIESCFVRIKLIYVLLLFVLTLLVQKTLGSGDIFYALKIYINNMNIFLSVIATFIIFYRYANTDSSKWLYMSNASYTIYLFHHLLVVTLGAIFMNSVISPVFLLILVITLTFIMSVSIHHFFVLKLSFARYMFNGK